MTARPSPPTRFAPPRVGARHVVRARLLGALGGLGQRRLALITGSPGYGKTMLLAQFRQQCMKTGAEVAWISLTPEDAGFPDFCAALLRALQCLGVVDESALPASVPSAAVVEGLAALVVEDVADSSREVYLMLDDYQHIVDPWAHRLLHRILEQGPPNLHVAIASRVAPPLSLSRLRLMDQVVELDAGSLPFDAAETRSFLVENLGEERATADAVVQVHELTGGWPSCLQLVAIMLRQRPGQPDALRALVWRSGDLQTYLSEAVMALLRPGLSTFAESLSVLRRITPQLAAAVTGEPDAASLLKRMEDENLLISRVDSADIQPWYRLHPLFTEFLAARLSRQGPARLAELHGRAAEWFADAGLFADAVRHANLAGDVDFAVKVIERSAPAAWSLEYMAPTLRLLDRLPEETLFRHTSLFFLACLTISLTARPERVERWLAQWRQRSDPQKARLASVQLALLEAVIALQRDDTQRVLALLDDGQEPVPADPFLRYVTVAALATAYGAAGRFAETRRLLDRFPAPANERNDEMALVAEGARLRGLLLEGQYGQVERLASALHARALRWHGPRSICANLSATFVADACYELDRVDEARAMLAQRAGLLRSCTPDVMVRASLCRARLDGLQEGPEPALAFLQEQLAYMRAIDLDRGAAQMLGERVRLLLAGGARAQAQEACEELDRLADRHARSTGFHAEVPLTAALARGRLHAGEDPGHALRHMDMALSMARALGRGRELALLDLLRAPLLEALRRPTEALDAAARSLEYGARLGLVRTFLDEGPLASTWLRRLANGGVLSETAARHAARLHEMLRQQQGTGCADVGSARPQPAATLTQREIEVLGLVGQAMSNKRIALTLGITLQTVKWNLRNVFAKLGVSSRYDAMVWARRQELIG